MILLSVMRRIFALKLVLMGVHFEGVYGLLYTPQELY